MKDMLWYETYHGDEEEDLKAPKKKKPRNRAILDNDSRANRIYKPNKIKVIRKN